MWASISQNILAGLLKVNFFVVKEYKEVPSIRFEKYYLYLYYLNIFKKC